MNRQCKCTDCGYVFDYEEANNYDVSLCGLWEPV